MKGRVVSSLYGKYRLFYNGQNSESLFTLKGSLSKQKIRIVAGDYVEFNHNDLTIELRYERSSYLKRPEVANIDYLVVVSSIKEPIFSYDLIFKYITYANSNGVKSFVLITKIDIADSAKMAEIKDVFNKLDIDVYFISNKTLQGIDDIKKILSGKTFCLMGQSGVGKSSFINSLENKFSRSVGQYSQSLGRGKHQTKETILLPYNTGFVVDTPGFSSLDLDLKKNDIAHFFPSFEKYYPNCEYFDCSHINEKKCAVKDAVKQEKIPLVAYDSYMKLLSESLLYKRR